MNRIVVTGYAAVFLVLIPVLEISETHLLNEDWPGHARLHEAWQLLANGMIAGTALYLVWRKGRAFAALLLCLPLSLPFLIAWALQGTYGGSMLHTDGTQIAIYGINVAVPIVALLLLATLVALLLERRRRSADKHV
ncbi:MAG: hypothetical protein CVT79_05960 [Alphaproteobacteria bacterium HGW-Alphaproteobacteria-18]|nr:MAG: hypothetical protein CVT79_05960 [Alphaproteobacteria bacterium HGW-Alphaproteobacteria-18]